MTLSSKAPHKEEMVLVGVSSMIDFKASTLSSPANCSPELMSMTFISGIELKTSSVVYAINLPEYEKVQLRTGVVVGSLLIQVPVSQSHKRRVESALPVTTLVVSTGQIVHKKELAK